MRSAGRNTCGSRSLKSTLVTEWMPLLRQLGRGAVNHGTLHLHMACNGMCFDACYMCATWYTHIMRGPRQNRDGSPHKELKSPVVASPPNIRRVRQGARSWRRLPAAVLTCCACAPAPCAQPWVISQHHGLLSLLSCVPPEHAILV